MLVVFVMTGLLGTVSTASSYVYPDLNSDHVIDLRDFAIFAANWSAKSGPGTNLPGDFDSSGKVDYNDLKNIAYFWLKPGVTQYGITWIFDKSLVSSASDYVAGVNYMVDQFVNGDWYVVGPVHIIGITPATQVVTYTGPCSDANRSIVVRQRAINGSMLNPSMLASEGSQGYDGALSGFSSTSNETNYYQYNAAVNVAIGISAANPLSISGGNSLVSTISLDNNSIFPLMPGSNPPQYQKYALKTAAVLTVLSSIPPANSFRPSYYYKGSPKTATYNWSAVQSNLSLLPNIYVDEQILRAADGSWTGDLATFLPCLQRVWLDHSPIWSNEYFAPQDNMDDYGALLAHKLGWASLLCLSQLPSDWTTATTGSFSSSDQLLIHLIQKGIDWAGAIQNQGNGMNGWWPDGGHSIGRKWPVMFAALMLGDNDLLALIYNKSGDNVPALYDCSCDTASWGDNVLFAEDGQTFFVSQIDIDMNHPGKTNYLTGDLYLPEYGMYHSWEPYNDDRYFVSDHRQMDTGTVYGAFALAALIMGQRYNWNHETFFCYTDRWVEVCSNYVPYNGGAWKFHDTSIALAIWNNYRPYFFPVWSSFDDTAPDFNDLTDPNNSAYANGSDWVL